MKLENGLRIAFKQESFISSFINDCRVVTLDSQMSVRVKTYSLLFLSEYGKVNSRIVRHYFEKDLKLLLTVYGKISQLVSISDLAEIREAISIIIGRQKM